MNCRPGDIARIIKPGEWLGYMVNVMECAPNAPFDLPDGQAHRAPMHPDSWACEALGDGFPVLMITDSGDIRGRHAKYVCISDRHLRPIRDPGDDATDEILLLVGSPLKETA